jgi:hypothetical protein
MVVAEATRSQLPAASAGMMVSNGVALNSAFSPSCSATARTSSTSKPVSSSLWLNSNGA